MKRAKWMLGIVVFGLLVSAVTVWPALYELKWAVRIFWGEADATGTILAGICIPLRGIPLIWFWFDFAFASAAAIPLWIALRDIRRVERM